jgi:hypothetical protein
MGHGMPPDGTWRIPVLLRVPGFDEYAEGRYRRGYLFAGNVSRVGSIPSLSGDFPRVSLFLRV